MLLVAFPWAGRVRAPPFLKLLAPCARHDAERRRRHKAPRSSGAGGWRARSRRPAATSAWRRSGSGQRRRSRRRTPALLGPFSLLGRLTETLCYAA
jgi:hypothetical protein